MRRDLERRLRAVEVARLGGIEYWVCERDDGLFRSRSGELLTQEEVEARARAKGRFCYFANPTDALL